MPFTKEDVRAPADFEERLRKGDDLQGLVRETLDINVRGSGMLPEDLTGADAEAFAEPRFDSSTAFFRMRKLPEGKKVPPKMKQALNETRLFIKRWVASMKEALRRVINRMAADSIRAVTDKDDRSEMNAEALGIYINKEHNFTLLKNFFINWVQYLTTNAPIMLYAKTYNFMQKLIDIMDLVYLPLLKITPYLEILTNIVAIVTLWVIDKIMVVLSALSKFAFTLVWSVILRYLWTLIDQVLLNLINMCAKLYAKIVGIVVWVILKVVTVGIWP